MENIIIFGVGAAGSNVLLNLVATNPTLNYLVLDCDKVEERNVRPMTTPYTKSDIGKPKVQALQRIALLQFGKKIEIAHQRIEDVHDVLRVATGTSCLAVDAFDNARSRNLLFMGALSRPTPHVLHIGFSGKLTGEVCWDEQWEPMKETKADAQVDVCELALARPFIQMLTSAAAIVISEFIETGKKRNVYCDRWLNMRTY